MLRFIATMRAGSWVVCCALCACGQTASGKAEWAGGAAARAGAAGSASFGGASSDAGAASAGGALAMGGTGTVQSGVFSPTCSVVWQDSAPDPAQIFSGINGTYDGDPLQIPADQVSPQSPCRMDALGDQLAPQLAFDFAIAPDGPWFVIQTCSGLVNRSDQTGANLSVEMHATVQADPKGIANSAVTGWMQLHADADPSSGNPAIDVSATLSFAAGPGTLKCVLIQ